MKIGFMLSTLIVALSACEGSGGDSAKSGGGSSPGGEKPTVSGPNIEGVWLSDCSKNVWGENRKMRLEIAGSTFHLKETTFEDSGCHQVRKQEEKQGDYSFESQIFESNYIIAYKSYPHLPDTNISNSYYQNIKLVEDTLLVSEVTGTADGAVGSPAVLPLKKAGAASPPGQPGDNIELQQGDYSVSDGFNYRDVNVAIGSTDGKLSMVVLSFNETDIAMGMTCEKNICRDPQWSAYELEILDTTSFRFSKTDTSDLAIYRKR